jgi:hypothetical protein
MMTYSAAPMTAGSAVNPTADSVTRWSPTSPVAAGHVVGDLGSPALDLGPFVVLLTGLLVLTAALYG